MQTEPLVLNTPTHVARKLRVPKDRVDRMIVERKLPIAAWADSTPVLDEVGVARLRHEINADDARAACASGSGTIE